MRLAKPVSEEKAFMDRRRLMRGGRRLLVTAGILALAFFFAIILIATYTSGGEQRTAYLIGDLAVTLGIAVPGLTLYILRLYTERSIQQGNAKMFSRNMKIGFCSISWVVLAIAVILLVA